MRKISKSIFLAVLVCLLTACVLCACGDSGKNKPDKNTTPDPAKEEGWEKITSIIKQDMYTKFLSGFMNVVYELSKDTVYDKNEVTVDGQAVITFNQTDIWLTVKGKYDRTKKSKADIRDKAILAVELSNAETVTDETRLVSLFVFKDELYLAIGDNKVRFSIEDADWTEYFPFDIEHLDSKKLNSLAKILATDVVCVTTPTGYRRNNSTKEEYKYSLDVNVYETLQKIFEDLKTLKFTEEQISELRSFVASVLGVSTEAFKNGNVPQSTLKVDFATSGNAISALTCEASVGLADSAKKLFGTDRLDVALKVNKVKLTNEYGNGVTIGFVNDQTERAKYKSYSEAIYALQVPIRLYSGNTTVADHYQLRVTTRVFQYDRNDNFLFLEYYDTDKNAVERALYVYHDKGYIVSVVEDEETGAKTTECVYVFDVDLSTVAAKVVVNDLDGSAEMKIYDFIAYILKSFSISRSELDFRVNEEFFTSVWYNFRDMIDYICDEADDNALKEDPQASEFIEYLTTNEIILSLKFTDKDLLTMVEENSSTIQSVLDKIAEYDEKFAPADDENDGDEDESEDNNEEENQVE